MKMHLLCAAVKCAASSGGIAKADDHLFQALQHGLTEASQPFQTNKAGHSGDLAPGQGSPFTGDDTQTVAVGSHLAGGQAMKTVRMHPRLPLALLMGMPLLLLLANCMGM